MNRKQLPVIALAVAVVTLAATFPSSAAPQSPINLRGFGRVATAPLNVGVLRGQSFDCDSVEHATWVRQKLGRDMEQSATIAPLWQTVRVAGHDFQVLVRPGLGSFLFASTGTKAVAFTTTATAALDVAFADAANSLTDATGYVPNQKYPMYLDKFDHNGIGSWYPYMWGDDNSKGKPNSIDDHFAYAKKWDLALQPTGGGLLLDNQLPKIHQYDRPYHFAKWQEWSAALAIMAPEEMVRTTTDFTSEPSYYGQVSFSPGKKLSVYRDWSFQQEQKKRIDDPNLVDWLDPNGEIGPFGDAIYWDLSENNRRGLADWLKAHRGYTLESLGKAWYGNPAKFASWNDVRIPMGYDFYGRQADSIDADRSWAVRITKFADGLKQGFNKEAFSDAKWVHFSMPGEEVPSIALRSMQHNRPGEMVWYRGSLTVDSAWLDAHRKTGPIYLNIATLSSGRGAFKPDRLWVNGVAAGTPYTAGGGSITAQVDISKLIKSGRNTIVYVPANPSIGIRGKFFLATKPFQRYPFTDSLMNARYSDWHEYISWCAMNRVETTLKAMRAIDPNRPIKVHAAYDKDLFGPVLARYGAYAHNTGEGSFLRAWDRRLGYPWGTQSSAEFGGSIDDPTAWKRWLGFFNFEGQNAFDNFHNIQSMMYSPAKDLWTEYMPYLKLANRRDIKRPDIALISSSLNNRLLPRGLPYIFDIGRGDLQSIGYSYIYIDEPGIAAGLAKDYPVVWDCGSQIMTTDTVANLTKYVEAGGTFVAIADTGRHTMTQRDAWPISSLTGFRVKAIRPTTGLVTIEDDSALLPKLAGRTFYNRGRSIDYSNDNFADKSLALEAIAPGTVALARYDDGQTAVGMRTLGKGRVIVLGSPFWRDSYDQQGYWHPSEEQSMILENLLAGLGLKPLCEADTHALWREHYVANNGTEEYLVVWNPSDVSVTANLTWRTVHPATQLYDPKNGSPVAASITGNSVAIKALTLKPLETIVLATQDSRPPVDAVSDWFARTSVLWHESAGGPVLSRPDLPFLQAEAIEDIGERVVSAADIATLDPARLSTTFDDGGWTPKANFILPEREDLKVPAGSSVLYRSTLTAPASWKANDRYELSVSPLYPHGLTGSLYLNGAKVYDSSQKGVDPLRIDVSSTIKLTGKNIFVFVAPATGFAGRFVVSREPHAAETLAVSGSFDVQAGEESGLSKVTLPGAFKGLFAVKPDVMVPASWKGSRVFIKIVPTDLSQYNAFAINGKVVFHPVAWFAPVTYMDITPWVKFGQANNLLILPQQGAKAWMPSDLSIKSITLQKVTSR
ncbi:MAG TPA: hypothetical protein VGK19_24420 [Capsulimonadaceae bacterium]|jgi:hypothetical protein